MTEEAGPIAVAEAQFPAVAAGACFVEDRDITNRAFNMAIASAIVFSAGCSRNTVQGAGTIASEAREICSSHAVEVTGSMGEASRYETGIAERPYG